MTIAPFPVTATAQACAASSPARPRPACHPRTHEQDGPQERAAHVVGGKAGVGHAADAGHERRKRAHDGHEACQHDRLAAVPAASGAPSGVSGRPVERTRPAAQSSATKGSFPSRHVGLSTAHSGRPQLPAAHPRLLQRHCKGPISAQPQHRQGQLGMYVHMGWGRGLPLLPLLLPHVLTCRRTFRSS